MSQIRNTEERITLRKLRLSNHRLKIETGRHNQRFCPADVEDYVHFILQSKTLETFRQTLLNKIKTYYKDFDHLDKSRTFVCSLTNSDFINETAHYIDKMFHRREFLLQNHKNLV